MNGDRWRCGLLAIQLLREHVAAERNSPVERNGREVRALITLHFGPGNERRDNTGHSGSNEVQQTEISADGAQFAAIFGTIRAEVHKLNDAHKIVTGSGSRNTRNVAYFFRKRLLHGGGNQRAAVGNEELQQRDRRDHKYEGGH